MSRGKGTVQGFAHLGKVRMHGEPGDGGEPYSGVAHLSFRGVCFAFEAETECA